MTERPVLTSLLPRVSRRAGNLRVALIGIAVALLIAACGQTPAVVLTLDSASAEVLRGTDVQIEVTLTRTGGASGDVALATTGLPASVTAAFSPATLSGAALTSTLTLTAEAAAVEDSYDLSVTATGAGLADTAELTLDVNSLSVSGRVVGLFDIPLAGAAVGSQGDTAVTGLDGGFTLTGLSVPYDLSVWNSAAEWVQIYEGLTTDEPLLAPVAGYASPPAIPFGTNIEGTLSGGVIPVGTDQIVTVCVEGLDGVAFGCDTVDPTESAYSISANWVAGATTDVRVHALQVELDGAGNPVGYPGYANMDITVSDGDAAVADLDLGTALATTAVDVEIDSAIALSDLIGGVRVGPGLTVPVMMINAPAATHEALMPVIADATYTFAAHDGTMQLGWQAEVTGPTSTLEVPGQPILITPADTATGITATTDFTASNPTDGPMTFLWTADVGNLMVAVTTMDESQTIPDISAYGLALPGSADFAWEVIGHSGVSTEGGAYTIGGYFNVLTLMIQPASGPKGEGTFAMSAGREFATAP